MARSVGTNAILEVIFSGLFQGSNCLNVFHYRLLTISPTVLDGDDVVDTAIPILQHATNGASVALRDVVNDTYNLQNLRYQWIWPTRYSPVSSSLNCGVGNVPDAPMPSNVAAVATKRSIFSGPHGTGSTHIAGLSITDLEGALLSGGAATRVGVFMEVMEQTIDIGTVLSGATLVPIIYNKADPADSAAWEDHLVQPTSRVMRRRTLGLGI